jgi:tetratricopeptide (TPR) repeat protein
VAYYELKDYENVAKAMMETLELDPDNANANNLLGYMWAEQGINLDESIALIERALELEPDNGAFIDSLGWAYYKKGWLERALKQLELAASSIPDDPVILDHLGDVYFDLERFDEAEKAWEQSLENDPGSIEVKEKLNRLKVLLQEAQKK